MKKLIAFTVIASLFCGCWEPPDSIWIYAYSQPDDINIELPKPLVYDRHEYNITSTGAVVTIYFTPVKDK